MNSNDELRLKILQIRRSLAPEDRSRLSAAVCSRFKKQLSEKGPDLRGRWVALFREMRTEVDLQSLVPWLQAQGAHLAFPRVTDAGGGQLELAHVSAPLDSASWRPGPMGIEEPVPESHPPIDPGRLDLILVPGVVFDPEGRRIGMGKGFYDRLLPRCPQATKIALVFDFQVVPEISPEPWDQAVDWVITDSREWTK